MKRNQAIPLVILAGSDNRPTRLPRRARNRKPLGGYKALDIRIDGRPMVDHLCEQVLASGMFSGIYIAGPKRVFDQISCEATLIETDGTFGQNIRAAINGVSALHPATPIAFITCDILPKPSTLRRLIEDYHRQAPCDLWFPMVRAPQNRSRLGASEWKPAYRVIQEEGGKPVGVLPGHLLVCDPGALRLKFMYRLLQVGYRTRNRPISHRRSVMLRKLILQLIYQDLLHLVTFRLPNLTWTMLRAALPVADQLKAGTVTRMKLEDAGRKMFVKFRHRKRFPERRILFPMVDDLSLALDIDTEEEAVAIGGEMAGNGA